MVFAITYDLNRPGQSYPNLYSSIKSLGTWWRYLDSFWLIDTTLSAKQIYEHLKPTVDPNDYVLIFEMGKDREGQLPSEAWKWIAARVLA